MIQVGYLYNNIIMTNPSLNEITNACLCYLIIHFLQQTERIGILHPCVIQNNNSSSDLRINEQQQLLTPTTSDSIAILCYGFAKFYSSFNFEIFATEASEVFSTESACCESIPDK